MSDEPKPRPENGRRKKVEPEEPTLTPEQEMAGLAGPTDEERNEAAELAMIRQVQQQQIQTPPAAEEQGETTDEGAAS
jgi:hypothetical protein